MSLNMTTIAAKVPTVLAARFETLARRRRLTPSLLLRTLVEAELSSDESDERGPIESTTRARLELILEAGALDPRASVACELARRLDVDPSNGAQHSRELMRLLDDLERDARGDDVDLTVLEEVRARRLLRHAGYGLIDPTGSVLPAFQPSEEPSR